MMSIRFPAYLSVLLRQDDPVGMLRPHITTPQNVTVHSLIHSPLQFCTPLCIILLFYHLELFSAMIAALAASLGP